MDNKNDNTIKKIMELFNSQPRSTKVFYRYWEVNFRFHLTRELKHMEEVQGETRPYGYFAKYIFMNSPNRYRAVNEISPN